MKGIPGARFCLTTTNFQPAKIVGTFLLLAALLLFALGAAAQSAPQVPPPPDPGTSRQGSSQGPTPAAPPTSSGDADPAATPPPVPPSQSVLPATTPPPPEILPHGTLPAVIVPNLEARVGLATLARVSAPNDKVLFKGLSASVTKLHSELVGGTLEMSYLRASNVFGTGQSNTVFTYLVGPVFYPCRRGSFVASLRALAGGARVAGVVVLLPNNSGFVKGAVQDKAWSLGGGVEKWFFSDSLALRVDVDALHTTFYNSSVKVHGEYDLRAAWGVIYYLGGRTRASRVRNVAGRQIE